MLVATPELARYSFATAVILGDAGRVRTELGRDPGLATQADTRTGWAPLHAAGASRWHRLDPARAEGLLAVARMLLDAGADPNGRTGEAGGHGGWTSLRCAVAGAANPLITRLLLERGAVPGDHDLYLAGFADDNHECLPAAPVPRPRSRRSPAPPRRPVTSVLPPHPEPATPTVLPLSGPHAGTC